MGLDTSASGKLLGLAALIAPVIVIQVARTFTADGPASAHASEIPSPPGPAPTQPVPHHALSPTQRRAIEFLTAENSAAARGAEVPSPMYQNQPDAQSPTPQPATIASDSEGTPVRLVLNGIMAGESRQLASINNRIYNVGDAVAVGWKMTAINPGERTVTLTSDAGRTLILAPLARKSR